MIIKCPKYILTAVSLLEKSGFEAYAVGGCVRDTIMSREPNDWDMTTSASPEKIIEVFSDYKTIPTGIAHGTVTVIIDGIPVEITTMRIDGEYNDNRHPDSVSFTNKIELDLARRDFTVNAIAYNPKRGIVDPYGGIKDIEAKTIRCVGNSDKRFNEDALRIIRALRFASVLDFSIDTETSESIFINADLLKNVAKERIRVELKKLLCGTNAEQILTRYSDIIFRIIPQLKDSYNFAQNTPYHIYDVWNHTVKVVANVKNESDLKMAALLHDIAKPYCLTTDENNIDHFKGHAEKGAEIAEGVLKDLRFSNSETRRICSIIKIHDRRPDNNKKQIARLCSQYGTSTVLDTLELMTADAKGKNPEFLESSLITIENAGQQVDEIIQNDICLKVKDLSINGNDLMALDIKGHMIGKILNELLDMVIDEEIKNSREELLNYTKSTYCN